MNTSATLPTPAGAGQTPGRRRAIAGGRATIFRAVMNAIIPRGGAFAQGAADYDLVSRVNELLGRIDPTIRLGFPFLLLYIEYSALLHTGRRFTRLAEEKASQFLTGMEHSRMAYRRYIVLSMKMMTFMAFYEHREVAEAIGYFHGCHLGGGEDASGSAASKAKPAPAPEEPTAEDAQ